MAKQLPKYIRKKCDRIKRLCEEAQTLKRQVENWCEKNGIDNTDLCEGLSWGTTVKDLVELNFNRGIGRIKLFNPESQECFFSGDYSELLDSQAADAEVITWEFIPKKQIGAIEWEFVLEIVCDA